MICTYIILVKYMKILYYDCFCGISGDMNLAALIDLGVNKEYLINELSKLNLNDEYEIQISKKVKNGISGTKFDVILKNQNEDHEHTSENASHHHHTHHHEHRNLNDIKDIINNSTLSNSVKNSAINIFMQVANAEALVHGKSIDEIHFHEVGGTDSIVDIVGAAIALDYLKVDKIISSTIQLGGGFVKCAHGVIPVPAPATVQILQGVPVKSGIVQFETTTPTGAAILKANVNEYIDTVNFQIKNIGYGLGTRDLDIPNVLRVYLGEDDKKEKVEEQFILETNIDDMNPELYGYIEEKLFEVGALDVFKTPIIMKKGRPAIKLSILTTPNKEKEILNVVFEETTSIGIRKFNVEKVMLDREFSTVSTKYGDIKIKNSYYNGKIVKSKPEYEDCKKIAKENKLPILEIYKEVNNILNLN